MHTRETPACEPLWIETARFIASLPNKGQRNKKNILPKKKSTKRSTAARSRPRNGGELAASTAPPTSFMLVPPTFTTQ